MNSFAITVTVPPGQWYKDYIVTNETDIQSSTSNESFLFSFIQLLNQYLWFIIGAIAMWVGTYAGIKILTSEGDQDKMKNGTQMLLGVVIGIIIVILSYAAVRLVVNLL